MPALLEVEQLSVRFGGVFAVNGVSLTIEKAEIRGLIGPNGAGKTTLFNTISGISAPNEGRILFSGQDITRLPAHRRAALGIRRTFQTVQLVQSFTVYENLLTGLHAELARGGARALFGHRGSDFAARDAEARILAVLHYLELEDLVQREVKSLSVSEQRSVEIAQALVARPKLVMLDEPTAGLTPLQIERLDALLVKLRDDWGIAILLVEHVVSLVLSVCSRITVLDQGMVIAEGTGLDIVNDPAVRTAYLGEEADA